MKRLTLLAIGAVLVVPAVAGAKPAGSLTKTSMTASATALDCAPSTSKVFAAFGDDGLYFPVANSGFESGTTSWTLAGGAVVAAGDATSLIGAANDAQSLSLPAGSRATSPVVCVDPSAPTMRFMLRNSGAASSKLAVDVLYTGLDGTPGTLQIASLTATPGWAPSPITYYYVNLLAFVSSTGTTNVAFGFRPLDATGKWSIDDVYIDPYKRCC